MAKTSIEWTDYTFNPWWGCEKVSPGCKHCYAETWAKRCGFRWGATAPRRLFDDAHWRGPTKWNAEAERAGERRGKQHEKNGDMSKWPEDLRVREWPRSRPSVTIKAGAPA